MALTFKEVAEILKIVDASDCQELVLEMAGTRLVVRRGAEPVVTGATERSSSTETASPNLIDNGSSPSVDGVRVRAPMVGSFFRRPAPDEPPYVEVGAEVKQGDPLCLIEVMKLYTTIWSPSDGVIAAIPAEDETLVEFDQVLFIIRVEK